MGRQSQAFFFLFFPFGVCSCIRSCVQMGKFSFAYLMAVQPPENPHSALVSSSLTHVYYNKRALKNFCPTASNLCDDVQ